LKIDYSDEFRIEDFPEKTEEIDKKGIDKPFIFYGGILGLFKRQNEGIIQDFNNLVENFDEYKFNVSDRDDFQLTKNSSVSTDPSQQNVIETLTDTQYKIIQGPPGTGKSQTLTAIITNALENGANILIVCEKKTALDVIYEKLSEYSETREDFIYEVYTAKCSDEDWQDEWKKYFHTVNITENIVIKPSWDSYEAIDNEIVIEIDPGLAFGTGTHETTALCAEFLEKYSDGRRKLLDIGCGSGILMLIGKKIGIEKVTGIDIDEKVEEVVLENFDKNNIKDNFQVIIGNLVEDINEKYDIIVSNILVDVLTELLESIEKTLDKDAIVIFSGILAEKEEAFTEKAEKYKLEKLDRKEKRNWVSLVFKYVG